VSFLARDQGFVRDASTRRLPDCINGHSAALSPLSLRFGARTSRRNVDCSKVDTLTFLIVIVVHEKPVFRTARSVGLPRKLP
jgi:hypothetical protein